MKKYNTLINIIGEHNDFNILATRAFMPREIVLVHDGTTENMEYASDIKGYYRKHFATIKIIEKTIKRPLEKTIENLLKQYKDEDLIINTTGANALVNLYIHNYAAQMDIDYFYLEVAHSEIIIYKKGEIEKVNMELYEMNVDDFISISGGKILWDNTPEDDPHTLEIYDYITNNHIKWKNIKTIFKDRKKLKFHDYIYNRLFIDLNGLSAKNIDEILEFFKMLADMKYVEYNYKKRKLRIDIKNEFAKSLILVSGHWLEFVTYIVLKNIDNIDDLKSGVVFLWDKDVDNVKNELDILASTDSSLICISCKDSKGYDQEALNELKVYSERIAKGKSIDILVSTYYPEKENVINRSKEMGINIVVFNGDEKQFKNDLENIILKK
ncbi:MAG: Card1-like endonuclease domain-containing protein [Senegalia sp. (in: firmicutes)]|uniref:Card1-like endonuclease domain-containing protein n=1 Tax=Senegalia sp. (in: firmicutes) TaxID=1924098 RepID=UPI003F9A34A5